jgi:DNA-binding IclR family transcriptional regulator
VSEDNRYPVKSLIKALNIVEHLGTIEGGSTLTEISAKLRIGKSTVHRLLATLRDHDFVWLDPLSSRYVLGAKVLQLSEQLSRHSILIRYGAPILSRLSQATDETCNLGVLDGREVLYLIMKESSHPLQVSGQVGKRLPAHCTAVGKALLSGLSREEIIRLYGKKEDLKAPTSNSISTLSDLCDHIDKVRKTGLAIDNEELYTGVVCMGTPIRNRHGRVVASISIAFPKHRIDPETLENSKLLLRDCAGEFSRQLGYQVGSVAEEVVEQDAK